MRCFPGTSNSPSCSKAICRFNLIKEATPGNAAKASDQFSSVLKAVYHAADTGYIFAECVVTHTCLPFVCVY